MACRFRHAQWESCALCPEDVPCDDFIKWYSAGNVDKYTALVKQYVNKFPDKYELGVTLMPKQKDKLVDPLEKGDKYILAVAKDNTFQVVRKSVILNGNPMLYAEKKLIELTGVEYTPQIKLVQKKLDVKTLLK